MAWTDVSRILPGEKLLWAGVLRRAISDYALYRGVAKHKLNWQRAHRFIFCGVPFGDDSDGLTFEEVCGLFNWHPDYIRRKVKELRREDVKKLEASSFRDCFDEGTPCVAESPRWKDGQAVPYFVPTNYGRDARESMKLKEIFVSPPAKRPESIVPLVRWALAT